MIRPPLSDFAVQLRTHRYETKKAFHEKEGFTISDSFLFICQACACWN